MSLSILTSIRERHAPRLYTQTLKPIPPIQLLQPLTPDARPRRRPLPPISPLAVMQTHRLALIPYQLTLPLPPRAEPPTITPAPAPLPHERDERFLLRPPLLLRNIRKIRGTVPAPVDGERDTYAVDSKRPIQGVLSRLREIGKERNMRAEAQEEGSGDRREADVFEGTALCVSGTLCAKQVAAKPTL